jgi:hypothetical protein
METEKCLYTEMPARSSEQTSWREEQQQQTAECCFSWRECG